MNKTLNITLLIFAISMAIGGVGTCQNSTTKKERRALAKKVKRGEITFSKDIDTVFIEKIVKVPVEKVIVEVEELRVYRDTCILTKKEAKQKRKNERLGAKIKLKTAKEANKELRATYKHQQAQKDKEIKQLRQEIKLQKQKNKAKKIEKKAEIKAIKTKKKRHWKWYTYLYFSLAFAFGILVIIKFVGPIVQTLIKIGR